MSCSGLLRLLGGLALVTAVLATPMTAVAGNERTDFPVQKGLVHPAAPSGGLSSDNCANAVVITSSPFTDSVSTVGASLEPSEPQPCGLIGATIWYVWTNGPNVALVNMNTFTSDFDTVLAAYTGTCGALSNVGCNDDSGGLQSSLSFFADPNTTYYIQVGGFASDTGNLVFNFSAQELTCPPVVIDGVLGSNSTGYLGVSGTQNARLNRNGLASTCEAPKACDIFTAGTFDYDAYTIPNESGDDVCVTIALQVLDQDGCNLQANAYVGSFDPNSICTNYEGDPGLSSGVPPSPTTFSVVQPAGTDLVVEVHDIDAGELGCNYELTIRGNLCRQKKVVRAPAASRFGLVLLVLLLGAVGTTLLRRRIG